MMKNFLKDLNIRKRLMLLLLIVFIPFLAAQAFTYYKWYEARKAAELQANLEVARTVAVTFDLFVKDVLNTQDVIGRAASSPPPLSKSALRNILARAARESPAYRGISWIGPDGTVLASSIHAEGINVSGEEYFRKIAEGREWVVSDLHVSKVTGLQIFNISKGIRDADGNLLGVLATSIFPEKLDQVLAIVRSRDAGISLIDSQGIHVFRYPYTPYTPEQQNWLKQYPFMKRVLQGEEVSTSVKSVSTGKRRLVGFTPVGSIGWAAAASRAEEQAMAEVTSTLLPQAASILLIATGAFAGAFLFARSLSESVIKLRNHAVALGRGERRALTDDLGTAELNDLAGTFNQMADEIRAREEGLESFSYTVSHDLRAPLRAINGFSEMLHKDLEGKPDEEACRKLAVIRENAKKMDRLIDDILRFSRTGRAHLSPQQVDMRRLVEHVWEELRAVNPERDMEIKLGNVPPAWGDIALLKQVLVNLLGNAVKYTRNRERAVIEVNGFISGTALTCCIRDNGAGFDMRHYDKLFGMFRRLHNESDFEGTGVGLAIAKMIIDRHGGRIWAEGKPGEGATFCFTLPAVI